MRALILLALSILPLHGQAFSLRDHKKMMLQALNELNTCFPQTVKPFDSDLLWISDLEEDLNIVRKDFFYSHYFNPEKFLKDLIRASSAERVRDLSAEIFKHDPLLPGHRSDAVADLGHIIHHIQDMASPPHVVPVAHDLTDGFEDHVKVTASIDSDLSCLQISQFTTTENFQKIHTETAQTTLNRVKTTRFDAIAESTTGTLLTVSLSAEAAFWQTSKSNSFGHYGFLGNHFGDSVIASEGLKEDVKYRFEQELFQNFKTKQLKLGVQATLKALAIFYLR